MNGRRGFRGFIISLFLLIVTFSGTLKSFASSKYMGISKVKGAEVVSTFYKRFYLSSGESKTITLQVPSSGEYALAIYLKPKGVSWCSQDHTSAVLEVTTPTSRQVIPLYLGETPSVYRISLGELLPPIVSVTLKLKKAPEKVKFYGLALEKLPENEAYRYSPAIVYRKGYDKTDVPLLLYFEKKEERPGLKRIDYYLILSNEDGGTPSEELISLWGHLSDIEWVASVWVPKEGKEPSEIRYQAYPHRKVRFDGIFVAGKHPLLKIISQNNNFKAVSELKPSEDMIMLYPVPKDFQGTREEMQDKYPWIYKVVSCELYREGKLEEVPNPETLKPSDLRNYLFLDLKAEEVNCGGLAVEVKLKGEKGDKWYSSSHHLQNLVVPYRGEYVGNGWIRFAVELPKGTKLSDISEIRLRYYQGICSKKGEKPGAKIVFVKKILTLNDNYYPVEKLINLKKEILLTPENPTYTLKLQEKSSQG